jgi:hypothetical protein
MSEMNKLEILNKTKEITVELVGFSTDVKSSVRNASSSDCDDCYDD